MQSVDTTGMSPEELKELQSQIRKQLKPNSGKPKFKNDDHKFLWETFHNIEKQIDDAAAEVSKIAAKYNRPFSMRLAKTGYRDLIRAIKG